jgi:signal transduction histidine kinase
MKFTPTGGTVTWEIRPRRDAACRDAACHVSTEGYTISVSDTGIGMNETQIRNLFSLVRRDAACHVSTKGTANEPGTGLGLIVCKEMLEKHGSTLYVESEEGKGSRFWFEV